MVIQQIIPVWGSHLINRHDMVPDLKVSHAPAKPFNITATIVLPFRTDHKSNPVLVQLPILIFQYQVPLPVPVFF